MNDPKKKNSTEESQMSNVTIEEVNRVLEVGRLLKSALTEEELEEFAKTINASKEATERGDV